MNSWQTCKQVSLPGQISSEDLRIAEHEHQSAFIQYVRWKGRTDPSYQTVFSIPNGGKRSMSAYRYMEQEGLSRGIPDIFAAVARGNFHGMFLEFKVKPQKPTFDQKAWLERLSQAGYFTQVAYSADEGIKTLEQYLSL